MTFDAREASIESGRPVLLAQFSLGLATWRFAKADQDVPHDGETWTGMPMQVSHIIESGEAGKSDIRMRVPRAHPIAELWRFSPPSATVGVILIEIHRGEPDDEIAWMGHVANVGWPNPETAEITLQSGVRALETNGLRRLFQRPCPHVLGGPKCQKDLAPITWPATVESVTATFVTSPGFAAAGSLSGGFIRWTNAQGITEHRFITGHAGDTVLLMTPAAGLSPGDSIEAIEGCDHTPSRCDELENLLNYGGLPHFMKKNPFDGNPIY